MGGVGQVHNYGIQFALCAVLSFIAFLWCVFMIDEEEDKAMFEKKFNELPVKGAGYDSTEHPMKLLFDLKNVKLMVSTFVKKRSYNVRSQILIVCLALFNYMFIRYAPFTFLFQFTEKLYNWDAEVYSDMSSLGLIVNGVVAIVLGPLLINVSLNRPS